MSSARGCITRLWKQLGDAQKQHWKYGKRGRRQWRHTAQPKEKAHRKKTRVDQKKADRDEHKKKIIEEVAEKMKQ